MHHPGSSLAMFQPFDQCALPRRSSRRDHPATSPLFLLLTGSVQVATSSTVSLIDAKTWPGRYSIHRVPHHHVPWSICIAMQRSDSIHTTDDRVSSGKELVRDDSRNGRETLCESLYDMQTTPRCTLTLLHIPTITPALLKIDERKGQREGATPAT